MDALFASIITGENFQRTVPVDAERSIRNSVKGRQDSQERTKGQNCTGQSTLSIRIIAWLGPFVCPF